MNKVLLTTSIGVIGLFIGNVDPRIKVCFALVTGTAGLVHTLKGAHKYLNARSSLEEAREEADQDLQKVQKERRKIEQERLQMQADLEELARLQQATTSEIGKIKDEAAKERDRLKSALQAELNARRQELETDYTRRLKEVDQLEIDARGKIAVLEAEWEAQKKIRESTFMNEVKMWQATRDQEKAAIATEKELMLAAIASERRTWEETKEHQKAELMAHIALENQKLDAWKQGERSGFEEALQQEWAEVTAKWAEQNKQTISKSVSHNVNKQIQPLRQELEKMRSDNAELIARLAAADEELKRLQIPPKVIGMQPHQLIGRRFQEFYRHYGIDVEITQSVIMPTSECLIRFKIWHRTPVKEVVKLFPELMQEFNLAEVPETIPTHEGYEVLLKPLNTPFMGQLPREGDGVDRASINRIASAGGLEAPSLDDMERDRREQAKLRKAVEEYSHEQKMLAFIPPELPLARPVPNTPLTELEMRYVEYLVRWRARATRNREPNLTNQDDILNVVYGVKPGRGTETEVEGWSLRDRLKAVFNAIGHTYRTRG